MLLILCPVRSLEYIDSILQVCSREYAVSFILVFTPSSALPAASLRSTLAAVNIYRSLKAGKKATKKQIRNCICFFVALLYEIATESCVVIVNNYFT